MNAARLDARVKLGVALAAWVVALASNRLAGPLAVAALVFGALAVRGRLRALGALAPALAAGSAAALLQAVFAPGPHRAAGAVLLLARVAACGTVGAALAASTPFSDLLAALGWARVPAPLLEVVALANRQRHALAACASTIRDAQRLRLGWVGLRRSVRSAGALAGAAACRALSQAEVTADALALRGAAGPLTPVSPARPGWRDAAFALGAAVALAACAALGGGLSR